MRRPYQAIIGLLLIFLLLPIAAFAQFPNLGGLFGSGTRRMQQKAQDEIIKEISRAVGIAAPLRLDQSTAFASVDAPANFHPKLLEPITAADLDKPLPPGDYVIPVVGYCTTLGIPSPGHGLGEKIAPLQGKEAGAVGALLARGTEAHVPIHTLQAMIWRAEDGVPVSQWSDSDRALVHQLIPDHEKELDGDYIQQIEDTYQKYARYGLPPLEVMIGKMGDVGQLLLRLLAARQALTDLSISDERLPQLLYQQTGAGGSQAPVTATGADATESPWSEIQPGVIARFTVIGGCDTRNRFEFRITPQAVQAAAEWPVTGNVPLFRTVQLTQSPPVPPEAIVSDAMTLRRIFQLGRMGLAGAGELTPGVDIVATAYLVYTISQAPTQPLIVMPMVSGSGEQNNGDDRGRTHEDQESGNTPRPGIDKPPIPVPGDNAGEDWKWIPDASGQPNARPGKWVADPPIRGTKGGQPSASWDGQVSPKGTPHWDVDDGSGNRTRYDAKGRPLTGHDAHGGSSE